MAIAYRNAVETDITSATRSPVVTKPTGTVEGDMMLMFLVTNTTANVSAVGGWAIAGAEVDTSSTDSTTCLLWKVCAADEPATWTLTDLFAATETADFVVISYSGALAVHKTGTQNIADLSSPGALAGPSVTPTVDGCMIVQFVGCDPGTGAYQATPDSSPTGVQRWDAKNAAANSAEYIFIQEYLQPTAEAIALDATAFSTDSYGYHCVALSPGWTKTLTESATLAGTFSAAGRYSDVATLGHNVLKVRGIVLREALALADAEVTATKGTAPKAVECLETATLSDTLRRDFGGRSSLEVATLIATPIRGPGRALIDGVTAADTLTRGPGRVLSSTVTLADTISSRAIGITLVESATLADTRTRDTTRLLTDTSTLTDTASKATGITLVESATLADSGSRGPGLELTESATLADDLLLGKGATLLEVLALADTQDKMVQVHHLPIETLGVADLEVEYEHKSGATVYERTWTEVVGLADILAQWDVGRTLVESATLAGTPSKGVETVKREWLGMGWGPVVWPSHANYTSSPDGSLTRTGANEFDTITAGPATRVRFVVTQTGFTGGVGLTSSPGGEWGTAEYFWLISGAVLSVYSSGQVIVNREYSQGDVVDIVVSGNEVHFYQNDTPVTGVSEYIPPTPGPLFVTGTIYDQGYGVGQVTATGYPAVTLQHNSTKVLTEGVALVPAHLRVTDITVRTEVGASDTANFDGARALTDVVGLADEVELGPGRVLTEVVGINVSPAKWLGEEGEYTSYPDGTLTRTGEGAPGPGGSADYCGAIASSSGSGYIECTFLGPTTNGTCEISLLQAGPTFDWALVWGAGTNAVIREGNVGKGAWTVVAGDVIRVEYDHRDNTVRYYGNGLLKYTSLAYPENFPLYLMGYITEVGETIPRVKACFYERVEKGAGKNVADLATLADDFGAQSELILTELISLTDTPSKGAGRTLTSTASLTDTVLRSITLTERLHLSTMGPVEWTDLVGASAAGNRITRTAAGDGWGDSGGASVQLIGEEGWAEATNFSGFSTFGLSYGNTGQSLGDIDYAFVAWASNTIQVYEGGSFKGNFGTYGPTTVLRVEVCGGTVTYWVDGRLVYTSLTASTLPLLVDSSIYSGGGYFDAWIGQGITVRKDTARALLESATLADTFASGQQLILSEGLALSDEAIRRDTGRTLNSTVGLTGMVGRDAARVLAEVAGLSGTVAKGAGLKRIEGVTLADDFSYIPLTHALATSLDTEVFTLSDEAYRMVQVHHLPIQAIGLIDTFETGRQQVMTQGLSLSDTLVLVPNVHRTKELLETVGLTDTWSRRTTIGRVLSESAVLADVLSAHKANLSKSSTEMGTLTGVLSLQRTAGRTLTEGAVLAATLTAVHVHVKNLTETVGLTDPVLERGVEIEELVELSDSLTLLAPHYQTINLPDEWFELLDTLELGRTAGRTLTEEAVLLDTVETLHHVTGFDREFTEVLGLLDGLAGKDTTRELVESATLTDDVKGQKLETFLDEVLTLGDAFGPTETGRTLTSLLALTDGTGRDVARELVESAALADELVLGRTAERELLEGVTLSDPSVETQSNNTVSLTAAAALTDTVELGRTAGRTFAEQLWLVPAHLRVTDIGINLGATLEDSYSTGKAVALVEELVLADEVVAAITGRELTASLSLGDEPQRGISRELAELLGLADTLALATQREFVGEEEATLTDEVAKGTSRVLVESAVLVGTVPKGAGITLTEGVGLSDEAPYVTKAGQGELSELPTFTITLRKQLSRTFSEGVTLEDTAEARRVLLERVTLLDVVELKRPDVELLEVLRLNSDAALGEFVEKSFVFAG